MHISASRCSLSHVSVSILNILLSVYSWSCMNGTLDGTVRGFRPLTLKTSNEFNVLEYRFAAAVGV